MWLKLFTILVMWICMETKNSSQYDLALEFFNVVPRNTGSFAMNVPTEYVTFRCEPKDNDEVVTWARNVTHLPTEETIVVDGVVVPGFEYTYIAINSSTLYVKNVTIVYESGSYYGLGGKLRCGLIGATVSAHAYLTILSTGGGATYQRFTLGQWCMRECSQGYSGDWGPVGTFVEYPLNRTWPTTITIKPYTTGHLNLRAYIMVEERHATSQFGCHFYFTSPPAGLIPEDDLQNVYSRNIPTFNFVHSLSQVTLHRGPHRVEMYPMSSQYYVQDVIRCQAVGYPQVEFQWTFNNQTLNHTSELVITQNMMGWKGIFNCTTKNNQYPSDAPLKSAFSSVWVNAKIIGASPAHRNYFTRWPANQVTVRGQPVIFNCTPVEGSEIVYWARQLHDALIEDNVVYDGQVIPDYDGQYDVVAGQHDILVNNTEPQRLKCGLLLGNVAVHAFLVTLETKPRCGHNLTHVNSTQVSQGVHLYCEATYTGLWAPVMTWGIMDTYGDKWDLDTNSVNETSGNTIRHSLYLTLSATYNETVIQCKTHFLPPPEGVIPADDDQNMYNHYAPTWSHWYKTDRFFVY